MEMKMNNRSGDFMFVLSPLDDRGSQMNRWKEVHKESGVSEMNQF